MRSLRSPEVMFDVAAEADLIWELSRLCRERAIEGMDTRLAAGRAAVPQRRSARLQRSGVQRERKSTDPARVVIEITERTAIKDYPKFRERLKAFRERGLPLRRRRRGQRLRGPRIDRQPRAGLHQARHLADQRDRHELHQAEPRRDDGEVRERPRRDGDRRRRRARRGVQDGEGAGRASRAGILPAPPAVTRRRRARDAASPRSPSLRRLEREQRRRRASNDRSAAPRPLRTTRARRVAGVAARAAHRRASAPSARRSVSRASSHRPRRRRVERGAPASRLLSCRGPKSTGAPNAAGSSTECSPAAWKPPPTNATSASA